MWNSKWQMNRIGLIDFWYYDEEEFYLLDGRMLLRGSNGSGKSVTMQSFIPLLLDGNMRPERLDPFGSRARKMENYLLEEGDEREERTGYLFMEFKRQEADAYLTIGIGLRARKNKSLDTWYFYINDGRRMGVDFFLYKDVDNKITYTKQELRNKIGEGGRILESQSEYMECVNRLLFGFETLEQYKEMLDLLIQLRTPKLSKDFKPTIINDILSNSLQTLSEDDLRPMSEAIENMDTLKTNLDSLKDSVQAAKQIERVYDNYNQTLLYQKADYLVKAAAQNKACEEGIRELEEVVKTTQEEIVREEERYAQLTQEAELHKKEKDSLTASDAAKLKEQELTLEGEKTEEEQQVRKKEAQEADKEDKQKDVLTAIKKQEAINEQKREKIEEALGELGEELMDIPFDEYAFLKSELIDHMEEAYDFHSHTKLLEDYIRKVEEGVHILNQEKLDQQQFDAQLKHTEELRQERDKGEREAVGYRGQLQEIRGELVEAIYRWEKNNQELHLSREQLIMITRRLEEFDENKDYGDIREIVREEKNRLEDGLREQSGEAGSRLKEARERLKEKEEELKEWEERKDPEPEVSPAVEKNRRLLKEKGIPFQQFYKTVDFEEGGTRPETVDSDSAGAVSGNRKARLEEALLSMGILDALIVPAQYREQVLKLDKGVCDHYIFSDVTQVKQNLMEFLDVDNPDGNILFYQEIAHILSSIGYTAGEGGAGTWINEDGSYRLGILEGTVTGEYESRYIGAGAREAYRQKRIGELKMQADTLQENREEAEAVVQGLVLRRELLDKEWSRFPEGEDLKTAARELGDILTALERVGRQLTEAQKKLQETEKHLTETKRQVQAICQKCYLSPRMELFLQARSNLGSYKNLLTRLQIDHAAYLTGMEQLQNLKLQADGLEEDLDEIRYDLGRFRRRLSELWGQLTSIRQQLMLTNYEEIRERLDTCVRRLQEIPGEKEHSVAEKTSLLRRLEQAGEKQRENEVKILQTRIRLKLFGRAFEEEYKLGYVTCHFVITQDMEDQAKKVCQMLSGACGGRKLNELFGNVQESYHQNRGYLLDYNLTMDSLFEDLPEEEAGPMPSVKRIDIKARYRGSVVSFQELIGKLETDKEVQENLLSDKDRELFEDILANTVSKKIRARIHASNLWVEMMNELMESMITSSGLRLSLKWKSRRAEQEEQLDTRALVAMLQKDAEIMREEEIETLSRHFRSKISQARKLAGDNGQTQTFHAIMREVLDYRKWFEFQLEFLKTGEAKKELTDRAFFTFSGGEKAMAMYVPLFSAVVAKYAGARPDAPRMISLDEAFAGVDEMNIKDMFRLMVNFEFNFIINSQILWGDYETVPSIAVYQLIRPENAKYVTVISYVWNGRVRSLVKSIGDGIES